MITHLLDSIRADRLHSLTNAGDVTENREFSAHEPTEWFPSQHFIIKAGVLLMRHVRRTIAPEACLMTPNSAKVGGKLNRKCTSLSQAMFLNEQDWLAPYLTGLYIYLSEISKGGWNQLHTVATDYQFLHAGSGSRVLYGLSFHAAKTGDMAASCGR